MSQPSSGSFHESDEAEEEFAGKLKECFGLGGLKLEGHDDENTAEIQDKHTSLATDSQLPGEPEYGTDEEETVAVLSDRVPTLLKGKGSPVFSSVVPVVTPPPVSPASANGGGDAQPFFAQNEEQESVSPVKEVKVAEENGHVPHPTEVAATTPVGEDIHVENEVGLLVTGCHSVRETMNAYREKGSGEPKRIPSPEFGKIGGDIEHISAAGAGLPNGDGASQVPGEMATIAAGNGVGKAKEAASPSNPNSGGVGVAPGSHEKKKQKKNAPHELGDPVKKLPPSLVGNKNSRPASGTPRNFTPLVLKSIPSPSKSASSVSKSASSTSKSPVSPLSPIVGKNRTPLERPHTARNSRPEDSPLAVEGLLLGVAGNQRRTPDFARLFKPTASSSAKHSVGSPSTPTKTKPSPSKSLGDNRLRKSTSMMGDAGASVSGSPAAPAPATPPVGAGGDKAGSSSFKEQFTAFSRFGDATSDGKQITLSNADKWMKQAHVVDGKKITTTDTSITFKKLFKTAKKVGCDDFQRYVEDLAKSKGMEGKDVLEKLAHCGPPGHSSATKAAHAGVVSRLTDTSKYTGSHKERFDASGKGKGIEGRRDVQDNSGYVAAFKAKQESSPTPK